MDTWTVYMLKCADDTHYTGCTMNLEKRLIRHRRGEVKYTSTRLPIEVETYIVFTDKYKAFYFEKYLKSGSGRAFALKRLIVKK
ncbi:MAG: GIY-YIG nuclease family protein [Reichenbachiella sp.]|uniref:GIY-YIG nuclease family protein n=1 Tax=Reichenbachiella sp. TaxID=2184521 RepID=UPI003296DB06